MSETNVSEKTYFVKRETLDAFGKALEEATQLDADEGAMELLIHLCRQLLTEARGEEEPGDLPWVPR